MDIHIFEHAPNFQIYQGIRRMCIDVLAEFRKEFGSRNSQQSDYPDQNSK